jgi:hypothetical protein
LPTQWTLPLLLDTDWDVIAPNPDEALTETVVAAEQLAYVDVHVGFYRNTERRGGDAWRRGAGWRFIASPPKSKRATSRKPSRSTFA